jgi:lipoate-protein ligase A
VYLRHTGGCITPQARGILNVTQVFRAPRDLGIDASYDRLCSPIEEVLQDFGHKATRGLLPNVFCNGRHNVQIDGKKFAGTAQRRSLCRDDGASVAILNHALLLIEPLPMIVFEALKLFHETLGDTVFLQPNAHGWLSSQPRSTFVSALTMAYKSSEKTVKQIEKQMEK